MSAMRHDVDVIGIERPDQHVPFVAGADDADAQRIVDLLVAEVVAAERADAAGRDGGRDAALEEVAPRGADGLLEVLFADFLFFRR